MDIDNIRFTLDLRENIRAEIDKINAQLSMKNESYCDTDRDNLREMRERLISFMDYVYHLELKGLLEEDV